MSWKHFVCISGECEDGWCEFDTCIEGMTPPECPKGSKWEEVPRCHDCEYYTGRCEGDCHTPMNECFEPKKVRTEEDVVGYTLENVIVCKKCFMKYMKEGTATTADIEDIFYKQDKPIRNDGAPGQITCEQCLRVIIPVEE